MERDRTVNIPTFLSKRAQSKREARIREYETRVRKQRLMRYAGLGTAIATAFSIYSAIREIRNNDLDLGNYFHPQNYASASTNPERPSSTLRTSPAIKTGTSLSLEQKITSQQDPVQSSAHNPEIPEPESENPIITQINETYQIKTSSTDWRDTKGNVFGKIDVTTKIKEGTTKQTLEQRMHTYAHIVEPAAISNAIKFKLDHDYLANLVYAIIEQESDYNPNLVQPGSHATGLMQIMPGNHNGKDLKDPAVNIFIGTNEIASDLRHFLNEGKDLEEATVLALAGYNAGMGAVHKYKGVPPYMETKGYVHKVPEILQRTKEIREKTIKVQYETHQILS